MKWTDIRKLEVGDTIVFGDHQQGRLCSATWEGEVLHVTVKGGIKVRVINYDEPDREYEKWVPYHHVQSFPRRSRVISQGDSS